MDELTAPLGQSRAARRRPAGSSAVPRALALALGLGLLGLVLWAVVGRLPFDREPVPVVPVAAGPPPGPAPQQVQANAPVAPLVQPRPERDRAGPVREPESSRRTVTIIDGMSGKRQEVVIDGPEPAPHAAR